MKSTRRITVIGGGITGLTAAYYLQKELQTRGVTADIQLLESSSSYGGKIHTMERDGIVFEKGPDSFLARKLPMIELTQELGLEGELVGTNPEARRSYVLHQGRLHLMPPGLVLGIPSQIRPFLASELLTPEGKQRALLDLVLPARKEQDDESLGDLLERRLGKEVLLRIAEPLLAGIYAGDTYALSVKATFPQFAEMERNYGSLIKGTMQTVGKSGSTVNLPGLPPAAGQSAFLTYRRGLQTIVQGLVSALEAANVRLRPNTKALRIVKAAEGGYTLTLQDGRAEHSDALIVALPSYYAGELLEGEVDAGFLSNLPYVSVANVVLCFKRDDVQFTFDGSGFVIPRSEGRFITACTWTSVKWLHTAPNDKLLLRCYVGREGDEGWRDMTQEAIIAKVRQDLQEIMGIDAEPLFTEVTPLHRSMPQYAVGHLEQVAQFRSMMKQQMPGVLVTGAGFDGVGLPDCIRQGRDTARELADFIQRT